MKAVKKVERFGPEADEVLRLARVDEYQRRVLSPMQVAILVLSDGKWHHTSEIKAKLVENGRYCEVGTAITALKAKKCTIDTGGGRLKEEKFYRLRHHEEHPSLF